MINRKLLLIALCTSIVGLPACSNKESSTNRDKDIITVDLGADVATLDPQKAEDSQSHRVSNDLFEGLLSPDQNNKAIPSLSDKWEISDDGKIYTFHLRDNIKFSDGTPITADDVVFSYQRLVDPKVASPYNILIENIINAEQIIKGTTKVNNLGIKAIDNKTVQITLKNPDKAFLSIVAYNNLGIVSKANVLKFRDKWTDPKNMVTSGAYKLDERVVKGYILESKNPYFYDANNVAIAKVKLLPIEDNNSALSQYKSGDLDITYSTPIDQYKTVKSSLGNELHTVSYEGMYYYDLNMTLGKYKNNPKLRQALSMAINRELLVKDILGQGQIPLYAYATTTIEGGKFAGIEYDWSKLPHDEQLTKARELFKQAGYNDTNPLTIDLSYNTNDLHKKVALAIGSMWKQAFGEKSIVFKASNQEWKTFLQTRHKANYEIARDAWIADYDSVDTYTVLYQCNSGQNNSHYCNHEFDKLIVEARSESNADKRVDLIRQALQIAQNDYAIIPLYQYTYFRLIKPDVAGYIPENNHLDRVYSKWYKF